MRITKVYTRVGDKGTTRLVGGTEVSKADARIEAYGTVDELNSVIGIVRTFAASSLDEAPRERLEPMLARIQNRLFDVGADLATPADARWPTMRRVGDVDVAEVEAWIDELNDELEPLKEFVLPGGHPVNAFLHQARTVCRRAERATVVLIQGDADVGHGAMRYLNRLSDWLFVAARWAALASGTPEYLWERDI